MNLDYFVNYAVSNVFCAVVFAIMLVHDRLSVDRQEKQLKYDHALIAFILYFLSDALWSAVDSGVWQPTATNCALTNFLNYVFMAAITYTWLNYVLAVERIKNRNRAKNRFAVLFPFLLSTVALIITYIVAPGVLFDDQYKLTMVFNVFLVGVPYIYIVAIIIYTMRIARKTENRAERRKHIYIGFFPVMVVVCGILQMVLFPKLPIFAFSSTILMIVFYIQSMEKQISTDPLTGLNNRGQLVRYVSQNGNLRVEGKSTYIVMVDINDFKLINDNYGHAEGDAALVILAQSLIEAVAKNVNTSVFLGRYGGDEFVMIVHASSENEVETLINDIRELVRESCTDAGKHYVLSVGVGYDELSNEQDTFNKCLQRADSKLYIDKEYCKMNGNSTTCE